VEEESMSKTNFHGKRIDLTTALTMMLGDVEAHIDVSLQLTEWNCIYHGFYEDFNAVNLSQALMHLAESPDLPLIYQLRLEPHVYDNVWFSTSPLRRRGKLSLSKREHVQGPSPDVWTPDKTVLCLCRRHDRVIELSVAGSSPDEAIANWDFAAKPLRALLKDAEAEIQEHLEKVLNDEQELKLPYWKALLTCIKDRGSFLWKNFSDDYEPSPHVGLQFRNVYGRYRLSATIDLRRLMIGCVLDFSSGEHAREDYAQLLDERKAIETEIQFELEWDEQHLITSTGSSWYRGGTDPEKREQRAKQMNWLVDRLESFYHVFAPRLEAMNQKRSNHKNE
jgi:hypothetical protein